MYSILCFYVGESSKMNKILACFLVFMFLVCTVFAQTAVDEVAKGMSTGDVSKVSQYFDKVVDITINDQQSTYSKSQAEMVLKNFFTKNKFRSFSLRHKGAGTNSTSIYVIGYINTEKGKFSMYLMFKQRDSNVLVQEVMIANQPGD